MLEKGRKQLKQKEIGIYIHIPFCIQKCSYCDFCSYENKEELIPRYMKCLLQEMKEVGEGNQLDYQNHLDDLFLVKTIYIGGGTPSFIKSSYIKQIMTTIFENYQVVENAEVTIEVNPGTVNLQKLEDYFQSGINRLSIGLQSTHPHLLQTLGRVHTYYDFLDTYHWAREVGFQNINVDLMLGLPNQTLGELEDSLEEIISLEPEHISIYSLIVEEGTSLEKQIQDGTLVLPEEDLERKMYWRAKELLENNGYVHYEISNFAKPNYESKHNLDCWNQKEYVGFGVSAHSYTNNVRYSNITKVEEYIANYEKDKIEDNLIFHEKQNKESKKKEYMLLGLRKLEGVSIQEFKNEFIDNPIFLYHTQLEKLVNEELLEIDGDYIKLTNKGLDFANLVWEEFV